MKPYQKAFLFLFIVTIFDYLFRKGIVPLPLPLPRGASFLILFGLFAFFAWLATKRFAKSDGLTLKDLGITTSAANRRDFIYGTLVGIAIWGLVSIIQSIAAGFDWVLRSDISIYNILYGFVFIFVADLGTELYARGYPLTKLKESFGANAAIVVMVFFFALISFSLRYEGELLMYVMLIPMLHTIFFSIIYFKTGRLGAGVGVHTGANFVTNSIFDLRETQDGQAIPSGIFEANVPLDNLSLTALQMPYVAMAILFSAVCYFWWRKSPEQPTA